MKPLVSRSMQEIQKLGVIVIPFTEITFKEFLDKGGFSSVYRARWNNDLVAVKHINIGQVYKAHKYKDWNTFAKDFLNEVKLQKKLQHENILNIVGISIDKDLCVIMELCKTNLYKTIIDRPFSKKFVLKILIELSTAIEKIHTANIMHRDIKPHNIMIGLDDKPKLGDFGFASDI